MFNLEFAEEATVMTDAKFQLVSSRPVFRVALLLPAAAMIFLGSVLQLGMLGYGQINPRDLWPALMVVQAAWNFLATQLNAPWMGEISQYWPLLLVGAGFAFLLALKPHKRPGARRLYRAGVGRD